MTKDEILNMPAGREMDGLVGYHVMGIRYDTDKNTYWSYGAIRHNLHIWWSKFVFYAFKPPYMVHFLITPQLYLKTAEHYSTDMSDAWKVVESFPVFYFEKELKEYFCMVGSDFETSVIAETAPLAICRAALISTLPAK